MNTWLLHDAPPDRNMRYGLEHMTSCTIVPPAVRLEKRIPPVIVIQCWDKEAVMHCSLKIIGVLALTQIITSPPGICDWLKRVYAPCLGAG